MYIHFWIEEYEMNGATPEWRGPATPWEIVKRRFFDDKPVDATELAKKHGLDVVQTQAVLSGEQTIISPELSTALCAETGMSEGFFDNLSTRYETAMAERSV